jgi:hypothetical protein
MSTLPLAQFIIKLFAAVGIVAVGFIVIAALCVAWTELQRDKTDREIFRIMAERRSP